MLASIRRAGHSGRTEERLKFFNLYADIGRTENRLPHWQQEGAVYFVSFRLADAVPKHLIEDWSRDRDRWRRLHPPPLTPESEREYHKRFTGVIERWLDAGHGSCVLRAPENAKIVGEALQHFAGDRSHQIAWVVMPNHVHALFIPRPPWTLEQLLHSWKSFAAHEINKRSGTQGSVWQKDYFDRLVRDMDHFMNCVRYIRRNPVKASLRANEYLMWESDIARSIK